MAKNSQKLKNFLKNINKRIGLARGSNLGPLYLESSLLPLDQVLFLLEMDSFPLYKLLKAF